MYKKLIIFVFIIYGISLHNVMDYLWNDINNIVLFMK